MRKRNRPSSNLRRIRRWIKANVFLLACTLPLGLVLRLDGLSDGQRASLRFWYVWLVGYLLVTLVGASIVYFVNRRAEHGRL